MNRTFPPRNGQRGSAMLVTLILIAALLAGVAVLVSMQLSTTKATEVTRMGSMALHCAESGLAATHVLVGQNKTAVTAHLLAAPYTSESVADGTGWKVTPSFITSTYRDFDGGGDDVNIYIIDNLDSNALYTVDTDNRVWLVSRCTKYPDSPKEVRELIEFGSSGQNYKWQEGGAFGNNNAN
jgi:hypothetical protein